MITQPPQGTQGTGSQAVLVLRNLNSQHMLGEVALNPGDIFAARVLTAEAGQVTLLVRGLRLQARSDVPLQAGDRLSLRVQQLSEQRLVLQVLDQQGTLSGNEALAAAPSSGALQTPVNPALVALALPLTLSGQNTEVTIRVDQEAESDSRRAAPDDTGLRVIVAWEGPNIGPVEARLTVAGAPAVSAAPALAVQLSVATAVARDLVVEALPDLAQALAALGWTAADLGCRVRPAALLRAERQAQMSAPRRLDILG